MLNLSLILEDSARRYADSPAVTFHSNTLSYEQLNAFANRVANGLTTIGIGAGDKVALSCPNISYFPTIYFGVLKTGAVIVPLNILLKTDEIHYHLENSEAKVYICFSGSDETPIGEYGFNAFKQTDSCSHFFLIGPRHNIICENFDDLVGKQSAYFETVPTEANDTALIIYTSGTTGQPKGAQLTHSNLLLNALVAADLFQTSHSDTQLVVLPLFHIFGMTVMLNAGIYSGAHQVLVPHFNAQECLEFIKIHHVNIFAGVPTMYWSLLNYQHKSISDAEIKQSLRLCISGGAPLPSKIIQDFNDRFQMTIMEGYGMSEGSPIVAFNDLRTGTKPGSIGKAVWGVEIKVVDANGKELPSGEKGELIFKGHNVMKGYYNNPTSTADVLQKGWMHSGDIAVKDEDGFYFIVDRLREMIIRGGMNVYPREIEETMMKHEAISLIAVIGIPDDRLGEEIKAFIVLKEGWSADPVEIIAWAKQQMATYKYPRLIEFVDELPMTATGKILKKELRKHHLHNHS